MTEERMCLYLQSASPLFTTGSEQSLGGYSLKNNVLAYIRT